MHIRYERMHVQSVESVVSLRKAQLHLHPQVKNHTIHRLNVLFHCICSTLVWRPFLRLIVFLFHILLCTHPFTSDITSITLFFFIVVIVECTAYRHLIGREKWLIEIGPIRIQQMLTTDCSGNYRPITVWKRSFLCYLFYCWEAGWARLTQISSLQPVHKESSRICLQKCRKTWVLHSEIILNRFLTRCVCLETFVIWKHCDYTMLNVDCVCIIATAANKHCEAAILRQLGLVAFVPAVSCIRNLRL